MINLYDSHRYVSKSELARLAGVSPRTFERYLKTRRHVLDAMGVSPFAQKLPPKAVQYVCEDYCIDLPPELQDQQLLLKSPLYQQLMHLLQNSHLEQMLEKIAREAPNAAKACQPPHEL
jgi:hypothetical protein